MARVCFHVTSAANRESILRHGLDWRRMRDQPGIAGSDRAEGARVFLARDLDEAEWFVSIGRNNHRLMDIWEVSLTEDCDVWGEPPPDSPYRETQDGFFCTLQPVPPERLRLLKRDC